MKRTAAIALIAIANLALVSTSFAQSNGVEAKVPFAFHVGSASLPAGHYTIKYGSSQTIMVSNDARQRSAALSIYSQGPSNTTDGGKLLFHKYGSEYFLSEVLCGDSGMNLKIPASKNEKTVQRQQASMVTNTNVLVAAR